MSASAVEQNRLIDVAGGTELTWAELAAPSIPAPAAVVVGSSFEALAWARQHALTGEELLIVARGRLEENLRADLLAAGFNLVTDHGTTRPDVERDAEPDRLWLLTSGSTGRPKRIGHTLASLTTVSGELVPRRWLCPYSPGTYAWWQVVTLALGSPGQDLVVVDPTALDGWAAAAVEHQVTAASGTPTFWRQTMMAQRDQLAEVPLEQITLGGEPVDQAVLDQLRAVFPAARISWIYASSELGASIVVHDGRAGFPVEWLSQRSDEAEPGRDRGPEGSRPRLSVRDGELVIASPHHGVGLGGDVPTGDAVLVADGRVVITGRVDSDEINVGGAKVSAGVVRSVLLEHPDIAWAQVRGRRSPLVGSLVVADVVLAPGAKESQEWLVGLTAWCSARLPEYGVPRRIKVLAEIPTTETGKSAV